MRANISPNIMSSPSLLTAISSLALLSVTATAYVVDIHQAISTENVSISLSPKPASPAELLFKRDSDPSDFGWIKRWAAVGDSFTAGIGSGEQLGSVFHNQNNWKCSRYDQSYPMVLNRAFGPAVDDFQFVACSGDRSEDIYEQVNDMDGDLNLVIMTAGGNDLCLASMIKKCIFLPYYSEDSCQAVIDKAQENIDTILKDNLKQILVALNDKMADDAIVVYNGYAQYFNTDNDDCANKQNWMTPSWWPFASACKSISPNSIFLKA